MDNENIKELAQRIAKDSVSSRGFSLDTLLELRAEAESNAISVIKHILETHCIVEKRVIQDDYADVKNAVADWESSELTEKDDYFEYGRVFGNKEVLESYFSKDDLIGKEAEK